jgi:hypothetical protein
MSAVPGFNPRAWGSLAPDPNAAVLVSAGAADR